MRAVASVGGAGWIKPECKGEGLEGVLGGPRAKARAARRWKLEDTMMGKGKGTKRRPSKKRLDWSAVAMAKGRNGQTGGVNVERRVLERRGRLLLVGSSHVALRVTRRQQEAAGRMQAGQSK